MCIVAKDISILCKTSLWKIVKTAQYDTIRYIYVRAEADEMASLV